MIEWMLRKVVGTKNDRELKKAWPKVARINELEEKMKALSDNEFAPYTNRLKQEIANGRPLDEVLFEAFALVRESALRVIGQRHFDVQLIGGLFLHQGCIAEMRTGEGKTLTATLPSYLNALTGRGVHVVTVNDYLARRDAEWMGRIHSFLGLKVGCVLNGMSDKERQEAYGADITYGQNNEFGFDYLRDNMKYQLADYVQRELNFAIVDEVDSILIDEARTPLIISGPTEDATDQYYRVDRVIPGLVVDQDFVLDEKARTVHLTDTGIEKVQERLKVGNLYAPDQIETLHHVDQALRAHMLYRRDKDYVVSNGEVIIVDEFTGRLMHGRRWSDGLHQAIEAKEGVTIEAENQTLATISFQNYFRMYSKLSGMTGTADTEAEEFAKIYKLDVRVIPTNRPMIREDLNDVVYRTEREKFEAVADELERLHKSGQPVLVGTVSIAKSEIVSQFLKKRNIPHHVLNAKQHQREADIVAQAGRKGAVTISTNMAGRGTDIILGGNYEAAAKAIVGPFEPPSPKENQSSEAYAEVLSLAQKGYREKLSNEEAKQKAIAEAEREAVLEAGGLFILGTERHESRRVDNQLRGRAGRQGDPGTSKFFLSLEDDLMRIFGSERLMGLMDRLGMEEGEVIEHRYLSKAIEGAQKRVEGMNFDMRKNTLEYDDVMNQQRKTVYRLRKQVLASGAGIPLVEYEEDKKTSLKTRTEKLLSYADLKEMTLDAIEDVIVNLTDTYASSKNPDAWDLNSLQKAVKETSNVEMNFQPSGRPEDLQEQIFRVVEKNFSDRETDYGDNWFRFCQVRYLATIDQQWKDHLLGMDHLRQGVGLRGYGQKNPKHEYKREGFESFVRMLAATKSQFVSQICRAQPRNAQADAEKLQAQLEARRKTAMAAQAAAAAASAKSEPKAGQVSKNAPCPCGSGKKYKRCHGA
ncbi:MAG: preprotein translocase subunit SecA [Cystobacterineae bacterium]|nr:preprotein translocase subunit SecA [Cystobacterineae bacterium]